MLFCFAAADEQAWNLWGWGTGLVTIHGCLSYVKGQGCYVFMITSKQNTSIWRVSSTHLSSELEQTPAEQLQQGLQCSTKGRKIRDLDNKTWKTLMARGEGELCSLTRSSDKIIIWSLLEMAEREGEGGTGGQCEINTSWQGWPLVFCRMWATILWYELLS